jgi:hypothetical protein
LAPPDKPERQALSTKHARHVLVSPCFGQFQFQCRATHHVRYPKIGDFLANMSHEIRTPMNTINRDAQFHYLNEQIQDAQQRGEPVISVDTKKKELVGDFKNPGRARARFRRPRTRLGDPLPITVCHYPPRHQQVEQDRASLVFAHRYELARKGVDQPGHHRQSHRLDNDHHGTACPFRD